MPTIIYTGHLESPLAKVIQQSYPDEVDFMIIGDIPTPVEIRRGTYLEGDAVKILMQTMKKVGLPTDNNRIHKTTAIKTAYPKKKGKAIPAEIIRGFRSMIINEINTVKPKMVLILGKTAIQTVFGDPQFKITSAIGRVTEIPGVSEDIICIPILHPALIQRSPAEYKPFYASLELVATIFKGGSTHDTGETQWQVLDTEEKIEKALKLLATKKIVSSDMETTGLDYRIVEFLVLGIGFEKNKVFVIPREMRHRVKDFFALKNLKWIWQHGKYDTKVIWRRKIATVPLDHDVMYAHYTLDETSEHNLEYLSKVFLQAESYKYKMNQNFKAITVENYPQWFEALCERVAVDCDYTLQLFPILMDKLDEQPQLRRLYDNLIMPASSFLARVEQNGIMIDPHLLTDYDEKYDILLDKMKKDIDELSAPLWDPEAYMEEMGMKTAPKVFNPAAPKQMSWMVFKKLKLKSRRKKGDSTAKEVLLAIDPPHPLIDAVLAYRKVAKEQSTYVKGLMKWADVDGRVRTNFSLQITATGRLSSKEPNVQNQPNAFGVGNIRRAIIPPKFHILMDSDYSGAELRWLACLSKCPVLMDIFMTGKNLHNNTAKSLFGANYTSQDKMRAKAVNFGIPYGREAQSFVDEFNISREEAAAMITGWLDTYWGARDYLLWCADAVLKGYYLETPFGRQRRFGLVTKESLHGLQNEARNFPIQSASSDTTLVAAMELEPTAEKFGARINNLVHDSILFEVPAKAETILDFGYIVNQHMIGVPKRLFGYEVPFASDTDIGFTWGDLVSLNFEKKQVMWEEKIDGNKTEVFMPFDEWLDRETEKHAKKYEQAWYKGLQAV